MESNPWKKLNSKMIYDNPWITLREDDVINPGGGKGIYGTVHFKNLAIGIVPVDEEDFTWLVGQYRYPLDQFSWEIPEGGGPLHIDPIVSARRELREETGITAQKWERISTIHTSNSVSDEVGYIYLATMLSFGEPDREESEEDLQVRRIHLSEAVSMVMDNQITDSLSIAGLLKAGRLRGY
ncbi:MAG: NUDIX hydrolase [Cyclobacteriaceae bacterium]